MTTEIQQENNVSESSFNKKAYNKARYEANKEKILESQKAYREANKDKIKKSDKAYKEANKEKIKEYKKAYYESNKEKSNQQSKTYREANKEKLKEYKKAFYEINKEKVSESHKVYYEANKEKITKRNKAYRKKRKKEDLLFAAKEKLRNCVYQSFKRIAQNKPTDTQTLLSCSWQEAKEHFERLFKEGMAWENHGEWHIDHIRPVSSFSEDELHLMNHISNLQPLWSEENLSKSAKLTVSVPQ